MGTEFREKKAFGIPPEHLKGPIPPDLLEAFGVDRDATQSSLNMTPVFVEGGSYGGGTHWVVSTHSARKEVTESDYGTVDIESDSRLTSDQALAAAEQWIRQSPTTEVVPGSAIKMSRPSDEDPYFFTGLLLVRAGDPNSQSQPTSSRETQPVEAPRKRKLRLPFIR